MKESGASHSYSNLVIIETFFVGLVSRLVLGTATFGLANTTTIVITQTTLLTPNYLQLSANTTRITIPTVTEVSIVGFAFSPQATTVVIGINNTVMWTNMDDEAHTLLRLQMVASTLEC